MCYCKPRWRVPFVRVNPATQTAELPTTTYCQNCGEHCDNAGNVIVRASMRCPGFTWHHLGNLCLECGNDERSRIHKHLSIDELTEARRKAGIDPEPRYLRFVHERTALILRLQRGETIPVAEYQKPFMQK